MSDRFEEAVRQAGRQLSTTDELPLYHGAWARGRRRRNVKRGVLGVAGAALLFAAVSFGAGGFRTPQTQETDDIAIGGDAVAAATPTAEAEPTAPSAAVPSATAGPTATSAPAAIVAPTTEPATSAPPVAPTAESTPTPIPATPAPVPPPATAVPTTVPTTAVPSPAPTTVVTTPVPTATPIPDATARSQAEPDQALSDPAEPEPTPTVGFEYSVAVPAVPTATATLVPPTAATAVPTATEVPARTPDSTATSPSRPTDDSADADTDDSNTGDSNTDDSNTGDSNTLASGDPDEPGDLGTTAIAPSPPPGMRLDTGAIADAVLDPTGVVPNPRACDSTFDGAFDAVCELLEPYPCVDQVEATPGYTAIDSTGDGAIDVCEALGALGCDTNGDLLADLPCLVSPEPAEG